MTTKDDAKGLEGMVQKPQKPVSLDEMDLAIETEGGKVE